MKAPAFQWYVNDFLGSGKVAAMSLEEVGSYTLLLNYDWNEGGLPDELAPFPRWLKVSPRKAHLIWDVVRPNFALRDGRWYNPRLEKERAKQEAWRQKSSKGGHAGAQARWGDGDKGGDRVVTECLIPNDDTPSPSSTPVTATTGYPPEFELLWGAYPKREGNNSKRAALKAYNVRVREGVDFTAMQDGTHRFAEFVRVKAWEGTGFVMQASRFYGPEKQFLEPWLPAAPNTDVIRLWSVMKAYGFASATRFTIEADLARAKADGKLSDTEAFKRTLNRLNRGALRDTRSDEAAHKLIVESLAGEAPEGLAA